MKKILIMGSTKTIDSRGLGQHRPQDYFKGVIKTTYVDLDKDADIVRDLSKLPYPFKDNSFDGVLASHILEHLNPLKFLDIMKELHRICKPGAEILIYVPHFSDCISKYHLTHYKLFGYKSLDVICDNQDTGHEKYIRGCFNMVRKKIFFMRKFRFCKFCKIDRYEQYYCKIFPAKEVEYLLKVIKINAAH